VGLFRDFGVEIAGRCPLGRAQSAAVPSDPEMWGADGLLLFAERYLDGAL
jgi:hypothetical protein